MSAKKGKKAAPGVVGRCDVCGKEMSRFDDSLSTKSYWVCACGFIREVTRWNEQRDYLIQGADE